MPTPQNPQSNPGPNTPSKPTSLPGSIPEVDQPEHQTPQELPEHQVQAQGARKSPDPEIPERRNQPEREAPPSPEQDMNKRMDDQKDDPVEGPVH